MREKLTPLTDQARAAIRERLARTGRAQIDGVLAVTDAQALYDAATAADYNVVTRRGTGHVDLPAAWLASRKGTSEDSAVGVMLSVMFAGGIALMQQANSWRDFAGLLFGSVVSVGREDLIVIGVTAALVLFGLRVLHKELELASFDEEYAALLGARPALMRAVLLVLVALGSVACVRLVGALLTTALFVIPAATGVLLGRTVPQVMAWGAGCALLGGFGGLYLSYYAPAVPSGAGIVLCCALPYLAARLFAPRR